MPTPTDTFSTWLASAHLSEARLTPEQRGLLQAAFRFRQQQGDDYYSSRILSHFLLHCNCGLKVAQIARLVRISRPTASRQQACSSKQAIQQAHHRMAGRPYGKLLPRFAGPIAGFLLSHPQASRHDTLDFIEQNFGERVSTVALSKFLKKYGLDAATRQAALTPPARPILAPPTATTAAPTVVDLVLPPGIPVVQQGQAIPTPTPPFSRHGPSTPVLSC
jgi:hypothetical protein